jgi:GTP-binding protein
VNVTFLGSFPKELPETGLPEVAFAGRSNVGKSSALNTLVTPGRTQAINLFTVDERVVFADLPGYGFAKVPDAVRDAWKPMIERYLAERARLVLVVVLVDVRRDVQEMDGQLLYSLIEARIPSLVVATKADKLSRAALHRQLAAIRSGYRLHGDQPLAFSSASGAGRDQVWAAIDAACGTER